MSEIMKKSRIVSNDSSAENTAVETSNQCVLTGEQVNGSLTIANNDDISLQDLIDAELNSRLSNFDDTEIPIADSQECMISLNNEETESSNQISTELYDNLDISKNQGNVENISECEEQNVSQCLTTESSNIKENINEDLSVDYDMEKHNNTCDIKNQTLQFIQNEKTFSASTEDDYVSSVNENKIPPQNPNVKITDEFNSDTQVEICESGVYQIEEGELPNGTLNLVPNVDKSNFSSQQIEVQSPDNNIVISDHNITEVDNFVIEKPSIKDKLMLGSDEKMALLFSQTITSPAFTPTDENFDILEALKHEKKSPDEFVNNGNKFLSEDEGVIQNGSVEHEANDILSEDTQKQDEENLNVMSQSEIKMDHIENQLIVTCESFEFSNGEISPENEREFSQESENSENNSLTVEPKIDEIKDEIINNIEENNVIIDIVSNEVNKCDDEKFTDSNFDTANNIEIEEHISDDFEQEQYEDNSDEEVYTLPKISDNTFLLNDRKSHGDDNFNICTNSATLVMNVQNSTTTRITTTTTHSTSEMANAETLENNKINSMDNKSPLKKKKSKKARKDNEKENISVSDESFIEDDLSQVNVKTLKETYCQQSKIISNNIKKSEPIITTGISIKELCRSFGDLTTISDENNSCSPTQTSPVSPKNSTDSKSSFSKFDALEKKTVIHVRSSDAGKAQDKFIGSGQVEQICKSCGKQVFQMEQIKAEKSIWHKNCFRCKECNKQLNVDSYESHESELYCKQHFKALFAPKVVEETQPMRPRKHELIIRENQPVELPPDVVRASDKPDLGLEELQSLNVKSRFQVFENANEQENNLERTPSNVNVKRSPSILSKLAKFQAKGMDIGVTDDSLNGIPVEESSEESEESEDDLEGEDADLIRAKRKTAQKEQPVVFDKLSDLKSKWETGNQLSKEERREERKQEIQNIRSRLFLGKQGKMKEMYQQAVMESESGANIKKQIEIEISDNAKSIKEKFERGETLTKDEMKTMKDEDLSVCDAGIGKKSRSLFLELDAHADKPPHITPSPPIKTQVNVKQAREAFARTISEDVVKCTDSVDDIQIETADISSKFKFFETYKQPEKVRKQFRITPPRDGVVKANSPDREIYHDPDVVRSEDNIDDPSVAEKTHTASKMLSIFRQLEEKSSHETVPTGPKPLKRFTPPPEPQRDESDSEEDVTDSEGASEGSDSEVEGQPGTIKANEKTTDEYLIQAQKAARAKQLRAKFERWETNEIEREQRDRNSSSVNLAEECSEETIESARALRAKFESMRDASKQPEKQPRIKVNRFV